MRLSNSGQNQDRHLSLPPPSVSFHFITDTAANLSLKTVGAVAVLVVIEIVIGFSWD